jgi:hypothetical protein
MAKAPTLGDLKVKLFTDAGDRAQNLDMACKSARPVARRREGQRDGDLYR